MATRWTIYDLSACSAGWDVSNENQHGRPRSDRQVRQTLWLPCLIPCTPIEQVLQLSELEWICRLWYRLETDQTGSRQNLEGRDYIQVMDKGSSEGFVGCERQVRYGYVLEGLRLLQGTK